MKTMVVASFDHSLFSCDILSSLQAQGFSPILDVVTSAISRTPAMGRSAAAAA